jgi:DNA-directed RNA polymerase specialized sigma24 family protein
MKKDWELTQEALDKLLDWLDPDREQAGKKYEAIRLRLIKFFVCRGSLDADNLADETINRVTAKVDEVAADYVGAPARYFYAVAANVHLESLRKTRQDPTPVALTADMISVPPGGVQSSEPVYRCLERCVESLSPESKELVERYYQLEKKAKIDERKLLAEELGIGLNALRIRAHRIRLALRSCVRKCMKDQPSN